MAAPDMRALSAIELLAAWERGAGSTPIGQALAILQAAFPHTPPDVLATLDVVQRDLCLLHLRSLTFGPHLNGLAACPACKERLELDLDINELQALTFRLPDLENLTPTRPETPFRSDDYEVEFRLPNSQDLKALESRMDATGRGRLLEACILSAQHNDQVLAVSKLPSPVLNALTQHISQIASPTDLTLAVDCPACGHAWEILFDIVSFFWGEISAWAVRLMREVHVLAMAYGWHEAEILAMSAFRRQQYLELIGTR